MSYVYLLLHLTQCAFVICLCNRLCWGQDLFFRFVSIPVPSPASTMPSSGVVCPRALLTSQDRTCWRKMEKVLCEQDCKIIGMTWGAFETLWRSTHVNYSLLLFLATSGSGFDSGQLQEPAVRWGQSSLTRAGLCCPLVVSRACTEQSLQEPPASDVWETSPEFSLELPFHSCPGHAALLRTGLKNFSTQSFTVYLMVWPSRPLSPV